MIQKQTWLAIDPIERLHFLSEPRLLAASRPSSVPPPVGPAAPPHGPDAECGLFTHTGDDSDNDRDDRDSDADEN